MSISWNQFTQGWLSLARCYTAAEAARSLSLRRQNWRPA